MTNGSSPSPSDWLYGEIGLTVHEYIAQCCTTSNTVHGKCYKSLGTVHNGEVLVEIEPYNFQGPNVIVQVKLRPTTAVMITASESELPELPPPPAGVGILDASSSEVTS